MTIVTGTIIAHMFSFAKEKILSKNLVVFSRDARKGPWPIGVNLRKKWFMFEKMW